MFTPIDSTIASFDLDSLRFACVINTQTALPTAQSCTIQATAVKFGSGATVIQELIFNPTLPGPNQFASASFPTFKGVISVNFQLVQSVTGEALGVPLIDNVGYTAYYKC